MFDEARALQDFSEFWHQKNRDSSLGFKIQMLEL